MKILSIGRGDNCNIYLDDQNISRRHAQLRIYPTGRMEIVDYSQNGTFINNVRIQPNAPTPVKRDDVVSFAHTRLLDWSLVPDPLKPWRIGGIAVAVLAVIGLAWWGISAGVNAFNAHYEVPPVADVAGDSVVDATGEIATMSAAVSEPEPSAEIALPDTTAAPAVVTDEQKIPYPDVTTVVGKQVAPKAAAKPKAKQPAKPKAAPAEKPAETGTPSADKPKAETPKAEEPKAEAPKPETAKPEAPKTENP